MSLSTYADEGRHAKPAEQKRKILLRQRSIKSNHSINEDGCCWNHDWLPGYYQGNHGSHQSPINVDTSSAYVRYDPMLMPLEVTYEHSKATSIYKGEHGFQVKFDINEPATIGGASLSNFNYQLLQFHAHWGSSNDDHGSEHTINGRSFPAELHFVHFNKEKYLTFDEAINHADGVCVLSVFLKVSSTNQRHSEFQKLLDHFKIIDSDNENDEIPLEFKIRPRQLVPENTSRFFTYSGSLTTPPFRECVVWVLLAEPLEVSDEQLSYFRKLPATRDGRLISRNYRPTMPINDRTISSSFENVASIDEPPNPK